MSQWRKNPRIDANQADVVGALREVGAAVHFIGSPLDLLVAGTHTTGEGRTMLMEVKNPATGYGKRGLNEGQQKFVSDWPGLWAQVSDCESAVRAYRVLVGAA